MRRSTLTLVILLCPVLALAQENFGFPFGKATYAEFEPKTYLADTSAEAYFIKEVAEAHIDYETMDKIIVTYHAKIRILRQSAARRGDVTILLEKSSSSSKGDEFRTVEASAFNIVNGSIQETKMDSKAVFVEKSDRYDLLKFAIPNVKEGSIIEYQYIIESPFIFNFRKWEFQSDIPKMYSEYWTVIPANYTYNITLRGYLKLTDTKADIVHRCVVAGNGSAADCVGTRYIMENIPAFRQEEFMTAKGNYISAINFELSEVHHWDGRVNKYTKEWKDADEELRLYQGFGQQLRKGKDVVDGYIDATILGEADQLNKAKKIYDFIKFHFTWNDHYGKYSDLGIKRAFDQKKGNSADINLSLIAALRYAGLDAEPVLLATRHIERPIEIHPVLSDFNYVIAKLNLDGKTYLLDAVDDFLPFGLVSEFCYNGKGRVVSEKGSYWMELKPTDRDRIVTQLNFKLSPEGIMSGTITRTYYGYASVDQRRKILGFTDEKSYVDDFKSKSHDMGITTYTRTMDEGDLSKPIVEVFGVEVSAFDSPASTHYLFNPFFTGRLAANPFKTETRNFPVDYGIPQDRNLIVNVEYPANIEVTSVPDKIGMALPNAGGKYVYSVQADGSRLSMSNMFSITKPVYQPEEYPYLRELYARKIQAENADIIFQRKK